MKIFTLLLLVGSVYSSQTFAKDLKIGIENIPYLPFYKTDKAKKMSGFAGEMLSQFAQQHPQKIVLAPMPIKRLYSGLLTQKSIAFKFPDNERWAQDLKKNHKVTYSKGIASYTDGVMVLQKNLAKGDEGLKRLGIVRGFSPWLYMDDVKNKKIELVENNSLIGLVKQAMIGRVDGIYVNIDVARYILKHEVKKADALVFDPNLRNTKSDYKLSTVSHPNVISDLNKWMDDNPQTISALKKKWGLEDGGKQSR